MSQARARTSVEDMERCCPLPGDHLIPDASTTITRGITIRAAPLVIWPLLGDLVRARRAWPNERTPSYTLLLEDERRALVLGALYDHRARAYRSFHEPRPAAFWHATWALVLDPIDGQRTRLRVRARVAATRDAVRWTARWMHPFNDFMDPAELERLKQDAERRSRARDLSRVNSPQACPNGPGQNAPQRQTRKE
jgi:hypothetical protein